MLILVLIVVLKTDLHKLLFTVNVLHSVSTALQKNTKQTHLLSAVLRHWLNANALLIFRTFHWKLITKQIHNMVCRWKQFSDEIKSKENFFVFKATSRCRRLYRSEILHKVHRIVNMGLRNFSLFIFQLFFHRIIILSCYCARLMG